MSILVREVETSVLKSTNNGLDILNYALGNENWEFDKEIPFASSWGYNNGDINDCKVTITKTEEGFYTVCTRIEDNLLLGEGDPISFYEGIMQGCSRLNALSVLTDFLALENIPHITELYKIEQEAEEISAQVQQLCFKDETSFGLDTYNWLLNKTSLQIKEFEVGDSGKYVDDYGRVLFSYEITDEKPQSPSHQTYYSYPINVVYTSEEKGNVLVKMNPREFKNFFNEITIDVGKKFIKTEVEE